MDADKDERIKARAHQIWEDEGRPDGHHHDHWARAKREIDPDGVEAGGAEAPLHPGMLGDGTEEQNLNQVGRPEARITRDEVEQAFKQDNAAAKPV